MDWATMPRTLSQEMEEDEPPSELANTKTDYVMSAVNSALGAVPFAGSLLIEVAGNIVPNQRIDRITKFAAELEKKLASMEQDFVKAQLSNEHFTDLMEEGIRQAARSLTDERRQYLASVIANSLEDEHISFLESKHLLKILGEINDIEVIWLRFYLVPTMGGDEEFRNRHEKVLERVIAYIGASQDILDKHAIQESYKEHLTELGLLSRTYQTDMRTKMPEFDSMHGGMKVRGYRITLLGRMLLRQIAMNDEEG